MVPVDAAFESLHGTWCRNRREQCTVGAMTCVSLTGFPTSNCSYQHVSAGKLGTCLPGACMRFTHSLALLTNAFLRRWWSPNFLRHLQCFCIFTPRIRKKASKLFFVKNIRRNGNQEQVREHVLSENALVWSSCTLRPTNHVEFSIERASCQCLCLAKIHNP